MIRASVATLALALVPVASPAATCGGANPAITSVAVQNVTTNGGLNVYHLSGTVTNLGSMGQPSNTLQFVDIWQYGQKLDDRGIPPLAPGRSYTFGYDWQRSSEAANGTTTLSFRMRMRQGEDCKPANGVYRIRF